MDLGATVCTPKSPLCDACPLQKKCIAYTRQITDLLPVRSKKQTVRKRYFHYVLLKWKNTVWIHKRGGNDIWENLHEPFLVEAGYAMELADLLGEEKIKLLPDHANMEYSGRATQKLTHQIIETRFFTLEVSDKADIKDPEGKWLNKEELKKTAFPKTLVSFLENNLYF